MRFTKILLPVDGSEHSGKAAACAVELVKAMDAQLVLLNVYGHVASLLMGEGRKAVLDELRAAGEKALEPARALCAEHGVAFSEKMVEGEPGGSIADVAKAEGCDCIVMGSRGLTDTEGLVLGSTAHKVLHMVDIPVLVVR
ncbi:MAG: universal stress protein [Desulfovibrionaceae bacterium]|jgi:nucleotide-binding universal stress UspA family protein|nr:universal stress protein [Desulfovibrionaceae bacterium]